MYHRVPAGDFADVLFSDRSWSSSLAEISTLNDQHSVLGTQQSVAVQYRFVLYFSLGALYLAFTSLSHRASSTRLVSHLTLHCSGVFDSAVGSRLYPVAPVDCIAFPRCACTTATRQGCSCRRGKQDASTCFAAPRIDRARHLKVSSFIR